MPEKEVFLAVVGLIDWVVVLLALHELATYTSRVFVANFVNLNGIVSAVEGNNESA